MIFVVESKASNVSRMLWEMCVDSVGVTTQAVGVITHPTTGENAIAIPDDFQLRAHPTKDVSGILASRVPEWNPGIEQRIDARRGVPSPVMEFLPSGTRTRTREQMEADGWFQDA